MAKRTIVAVGEGHRREYEAAAAVRPGMVIVPNSSGLATAWATADSPNAPRIFAIENEIFGNGVSVAYATGDRVLCESLGAGDEVNAIVKGGAAAIVIGDPITVSNDGSVKKGTLAQAIGFAEEAIDISGSASDGTVWDHVRIRLA